MLVFRKEGIVEYSIGAVVEMPYRVEGNQLVLPPGRQGEPEERQTITWLAGDKVRLGDHEEIGSELTRQGPRTKGSETIIGEWRGIRETAGRKTEVLYFFYSKGKGLLLMPFVTQQGSYSTAGDRIRLTWPDCPIPDAAFSVDGDVLTFTPSNAKQARWARY